MTAKYFFEVKDVVEGTWSRNSSNNTDEGYDSLVELLDSSPAFNFPPLTYRLCKETSGGNLVIACIKRPTKWIDAIRALRALLGYETYSLVTLRDFIEGNDTIVVSKDQATVIEILFKLDAGIIESNYVPSEMEYFE